MLKPEKHPNNWDKLRSIYFQKLTSETKICKKNFQKFQFFEPIWEKTPLPEIAILRNSRTTTNPIPFFLLQSMLSLEPRVQSFPRYSYLYRACNRNAIHTMYIIGALYKRGGMQTASDEREDKFSRWSVQSIGAAQSILPDNIESTSLMPERCERLVVCYDSAAEAHQVSNALSLLANDYCESFSLKRESAESMGARGVSCRESNLLCTFIVRYFLPDPIYTGA